ncbi:MAG: 6-phosphofructokinase [Velocimicrobium sp.]
MKNLLIAQSGGPTAAINATVAGIVSRAYESKEVDRVLGALNGIEGVLEESFIDMREKIKSREDMDLLCQTPSAALGSCRLKLKDMKDANLQIEEIIQIFRKYEITYFIYIGGNDSMDTVDKLSAYLADHHINDITVVGAPKTIDNDLEEIDHCPGFGSAAKYIGTTFLELERDCHVYATKTVTIVEVMGRNTGWLTAAASLARVNGGRGPDLIYLCEIPFCNDRFIKDVEKQLRGNDSVLIAISEGIKYSDGQYVSEQVQSNFVDAFGHSYISGAARVLEDIIRNTIGCKVRSLALSLMQRCAGHIRSTIDIKESKLLGIKACECVLQGENGKMASLIRTSNFPYKIEITAIPVHQVCNHERRVPRSYINSEGNDITDEMMQYLFPLIQGEDLEIQYKNGIPRHLTLY